VNTIFLTPYESNAIQNGNVYKVPYVCGEVSIFEVKRALKWNNIIVSTYDGLQKIFKAGIDPTNYILIHDEYHNYTQQVSFRSKAISYVLSKEPLFKKVICITGTPEGVLANNYKTIIFKPKRKAPLLKYNIIQYTKKGLESLVKHILANPVKGLTFILINNLNQLNLVKERLINSGIKPDEIGLLSRYEKDNTLFQSIVTIQTIPSQFKYILTTNVISDGINILNDNVAAVYTLNIFDAILERQFIARFRRGVENIYHFCKLEESEETYLYNLEEEISQRINLNRELAAQYQRYLDLLDWPLRGINFIESNLLPEDYIYLDYTTNQVKVNEHKIRYNTLQELHLNMNKNVELLKEYMEEFGKYTVQISKWEDTLNLDKEEEDYKKSKTLKENIVIELLKDYPFDVLTFYAGKVNPKLKEITHESIRTMIDSWGDYDEEIDNYKELLQSKTAENLIRQYIEAVSVGVPHEYAWKFLKINKQRFNRFIRRLKIYQDIQLFQEYPWFHHYNRRTLKIKGYEILTFLIDQIKIGDKINANDLASDLGIYLKPLGIRDIAPKKCIEILRDIYKTKRTNIKVKDEFGIRRTLENLYIIEGYLSLEDILSDTGVKFTERELSRMKINLDVIFRKKLIELKQHFEFNHRPVPREVWLALYPPCPHNHT